MFICYSQINGQGIVFGGAGSWSFGNGFARNVIIFGVDNITSIHTEIMLRLIF